MIALFRLGQIVASQVR